MKLKFLTSKPHICFRNTAILGGWGKGRHVNYLLMLWPHIRNSAFMDKFINYICLAASVMTLALHL